MARNVGINSTFEQQRLVINSIAVDVEQLQNLNTSGYASTAGVATYASLAGVSSYSSLSGISSYSNNSGLSAYATYSASAGISSALSSNVNINTTGIITAFKFFGDASGLYNIPGLINPWAITGSGINTTSSVGIGITNPTAKLQVSGTVKIQDSSNSERGWLRIGDATGGYPTVTIGGINDNTSLNPGWVDAWHLKSRTALYAEGTVGLGTTTGLPGQIVSVDQTGKARYTSDVYISGISKVGIGTVNPTSKLTVIGDTRIVGILTATTFSGSGVNLSGVVTSLVAGSNIILSGSTGQVTISATGGGGGGESYWTSTAAGIHTLSNVGIGTTNPLEKLQIDRYAVSTGVGTFSATVGVAFTFDSFSVSSKAFKSLEYLIHVENGSNIQTQKCVVMVGGTTAYSQEYSIIFNNTPVVSFGATISSGVCQLRITPASTISGLTTYRFARGGLL